MRNSGKAPTIIVWIICLILYVVALVAQDFKKQFAYPDLVVDHQYLRHFQTFMTARFTR